MTGVTATLSLVEVLHLIYKGQHTTFAISQRFFSLLVYSIYFRSI